MSVTASTMADREPISGFSRDYGADFSPTELYYLSESIANNANTLNIGLKSLEQMMKLVGGYNDSVPLRKQVHRTRMTLISLMSATAQDIQRLGVVARRGDERQKLRVERLTQVFEDATAQHSAFQEKYFVEDFDDFDYIPEEVIIKRENVSKTVLCYIILLPMVLTLIVYFMYTCFISRYRYKPTYVGS